MQQQQSENKVSIVFDSILMAALPKVAVLATHLTADFLLPCFFSVEVMFVNL